MSMVVSGVVANGVVVPTAPLPEGAQVEVSVKQDSPSAPAARLSASELMKLPREQRRALLAAGAAATEELYRTDKSLMGFDAFSEELDDDAEEG